MSKKRIVAWLYQWKGSDDKWRDGMISIGPMRPSLVFDTRWQRLIYLVEGKDHGEKPK